MFYSYNKYRVVSMPTNTALKKEAAAISPYLIQ